MSMFVDTVGDAVAALAEVAVRLDNIMQARIKRIDKVGIKLEELRNSKVTMQDEFDHAARIKGKINELLK